MSNYQTQKRPQQKRKCTQCNTEFIVFTAFGDSICYECRRLHREQEDKIERAMGKSYCPFCHMLLAEHKQNEAQLCLYQLRGYVQQKNGDVKQ